MEKIHKNTTHGGSRSKLYGTFTRMKERCSNNKKDHYCDYGGRGIKVCDEWVNCYESFRDWALANGYNENLSIDRINNDGNYEPSNCRWVTQTIQNRNTRVIQRNNTSGYRGVSWHKGHKKWRASICINNKMIYLGAFDYPYTAAYAYDSYVIKLNLEHTRNFT